MDEALIINEPGNGLLLFFLLIGSGTVIAAVIGLNGFRRPQASALDMPMQTPPWVRWAGAGVIWAIFAAIAFSTISAGFYRISFEDDVMVLHYDVPSRETRIERGEIERLTKGIAGKTSNELRVETKDGEIYTSAQSSGRRLDAVVEEIERWQAIED